MILLIESLEYDRNDVFGEANIFSSSSMLAITIIILQHSCQQIFRIQLIMTCTLLSVAILTNREVKIIFLDSKFIKLILKKGLLSSTL